MATKNKSAATEQHRNKVYQVLECLDESEHKRLSRFLHSPYFIKTKTLVNLYEVLVAKIRKGEPGFDRLAVWGEIQPNVPFDPIVFRKNCSDLLKWTEIFMAQEFQLQNDNYRTLGLLDFLVRRKIKPLYDRSIREARERMAQKSFKALDDFYTSYSIERNYYKMINFDVSVDKRANLEEISLHLDVFYWIEKLRLFSAQLSQQRTSMHKYELKGLPELLAILSGYPLDDTPELAIHYYSFLTLYKEDELQHYYKLRELLQQYAAYMLPEEALEIVDAALHYCTGKFNRGHSEFYQEYFDLAESALTNGVFSSQHEFAPWRYNNMVGVALRLGKFDWAEKFVEDFKPLLPPDTRKNTYTFNLARVYRFQKKYSNVINLLKNVEYEDMGYNLISKMMLLITYYELDEYDALNNFLDTFKIFLKRKEKHIPGPRRTSYLNLIKYTRQLIRLIPGDKQAVGKLKNAIEQEKSMIVNHEWLLEKLQQLG